MEKNVIVIGDVMIDINLQSEVTRNAPEANIREFSHSSIV